MSPNVLLLLAAGAVALFAMTRNRQADSNRRRGQSIVLAAVLGIFCLFLLRASGPPRATSARHSSREAAMVARDAAVSTSVQPDAPASVGAVPRVPVASAVAPIEPLVDSPEDVRTEPPRTATHTIASIAGLAGFILCICLFLDAGRRERYSGLIRVGSAAVFIGLCIVLWNFGPAGRAGL